MTDGIAPSNWKPSNTRAWRRGVARAMTGGAARINCFGPSTVAGYTTGGRSESAAWPAVLRRLLARDFGESGTGTIYFCEPDPRIYASGWKLDEPYGPYGKSGFSSNSAASLLAFGPVRCSGFRVTYLGVPASGKFTAIPQGPGAQAATVDTAGPVGVRVAWFPAPSLGDWQLRITPVGNAPVFVLAVEGYAGGVAVTNAGKGSTIVANLNDGDPVFDSSLGASVNATPADLSIVAFAENSPGRQTTESMKADYRVLLDRIRATGSDLLLCTSIDWKGLDDGVGLYALQGDYDTAVRELGAEYDVPVFDIAARWGHWEDSPGYYADTVHPTPVGYADIAAGLYRALHTGI